MTVTSILEDPSTLAGAADDVRTTLASVTGPTSPTTSLWRPVAAGIQSGSTSPADVVATSDEAVQQACDVVVEV